MKQEDLKKLHDIDAPIYAFAECKRYGIQPEDEAENFADCYEDGYKACWRDMQEKRLLSPDEHKMSKEIANEYARIAYNALDQLVINGNINPISQKETFREAMKALHEFFISSL